MEPVAPLPKPRLPTWQEAAELNSKRSSTTSEEAYAQVEHLRQMSRLAAQKRAGAIRRS
jgi:hypothetical protein